MLEPRDRVLLFEALQPPDGFHFDQGIGTTYTLDLLALLTAPLAFTLFEQQGGEDGRPAIDSLEILESLRRYADRLTVFCHAGQIDIPQVFYPQLAFVEDSIVECQPTDGGAFHAKVWVLRWINEAGDVRYRVLCLSRNLTFSRAWDTLLALDGQLVPDRRAAIARNRGLVEFVRALPGLALKKPAAAAVAARVETLAAELEHTDFELPDGIKDLRFWPLGIGGRNRDPLAEAGDRLLIVSPFLTIGRLEELAEGRKDVTLVSTLASLGSLSRRPAGIHKFYSVLERATIEVDAEHDEKPESEAEAIQQSDLHAKIYVSESGWDAHVWTGSANATTAAFNGNVELLVELVGPKKKFGIDALMEPEKGELRFVNLLQDADAIVASDRADSALEALERRMDALRQQVAATQLSAAITPASDGAYDMTLTCQAIEAVTVDADLTLRCWPVTVRSSAATQVTAFRPGMQVAKFSGVSFQAITAFFAFELVGKANGEERRMPFVLNVTLTGAPEGRRERVLRSLVSDRARLLRFLWLLLADEGVSVPAVTGLERTNGDHGNGASAQFTNGLFEMLLANLDRAPERLDYLNSLLKELRSDAAESDLFPENFDAIWNPVWRERERLRTKAAR